MVRPVSGPDPLGVLRRCEPALGERRAEYARQGVAVGVGGQHIRPSRRRRRARGKAAGLACSFCGKPRTDALRLVAGPGVHICAEYIGLYTEILAEPEPGRPAAS